MESRISTSRRYPYRYRKWHLLIVVLKVRAHNLYLWTFFWRKMFISINILYFGRRKIWVVDPGESRENGTKLVWTSRRWQWQIFLTENLSWYDRGILTKDTLSIFRHSSFTCVYVHPIYRCIILVFTSTHKFSSNDESVFCLT